MCASRQHVSGSHCHSAFQVSQEYSSSFPFVRSDSVGKRARCSIPALHMCVAVQMITGCGFLTNGQVDGQRPHRPNLFAG
jgi:hypothetical protein